MQDRNSWSEQLVYAGLSDGFSRHRSNRGILLQLCLTLQISFSLAVTWRAGHMPSPCSDVPAGTLPLCKAIKQPHDPLLRVCAADSRSANLTRHWRLSFRRDNELLKWSNVRSLVLEYKVKGAWSQNTYTCKHGPPFSLWFFFVGMGGTYQFWLLKNFYNKIFFLFFFLKFPKVFSHRSVFQNPAVQPSAQFWLPLQRGSWKTVVCCAVLQTDRA